MDHRLGLSRGVWLFLLILWGLFLVAMYHWGVLLKYFQASPYYYFTAAAGLLLLIAALKGVFWPSALAGDCACDHEVEETLSEPTTNAAHAPDACALHDHSHEESCACGCHGPDRLGWWPLTKAILLLAVLGQVQALGRECANEGHRHRYEHNVHAVAIGGHLSEQAHTFRGS